MRYLQDYAVMTAFFGFFSMAWFGWSQEKPPKHWRKYIGTLTGLSFLLFLYGIYSTFQHWGEGSVLDDGSAMTTYFVFLILEFLIAGVGAILLFRRNKQNYISPWVCFIVGLHFFGLRCVFDDFSLHILGLLLVFVSIGTIHVGKKLEYKMSIITGISAGIILMAFALLNIVRVV